MTSGDPLSTQVLGDGAALRDILALAGPEMAIRILHQMRVDLEAVATALKPAVADTDWVVIRAQTHVLIALAGTIGANRLHQLAIGLNIAAHDQDKAQLGALAGPLLADLANLQSLLGGTASGNGAAA
jgi:hypothetical protein